MFSSRGYVGNDDVILLDDAKFLERVRVFGVDDGAQITLLVRTPPRVRYAAAWLAMEYLDL